VVEEAEYPERTTDHGQATGKLYHLRLRVECTLFCNLQSWAQTHAVLVHQNHEFWQSTENYWLLIDHLYISNFDFRARVAQ
jgi:hypothetical protein